LKNQKLLSQFANVVNINHSSTPDVGYMGLPLEDSIYQTETPSLNENKSILTTKRLNGSNSLHQFSINEKEKY
tara:strand:- start:499 stop:717 length:219 start_codon:yes stop_codon:yes gene_type:complete